MKAIFLLLMLGMVASCATYTPPPKTKNIMYYQHPVHGEVTKTSEAYIAASNLCETEIYKEGVEVNGEIVTDRAALEEISSAHFKAYTRARLRNDMSFSGAYAGTQGALAVTTGNTQNISSGTKSKKFDPVQYIFDYKKLDLPEHIDKINALDEQHRSCIKEGQQFVPSRIERVVEATGEVLRSTSLQKEEK